MQKGQNNRLRFDSYRNQVRPSDTSLAYGSITMSVLVDRLMLCDYATKPETTVDVS